MANRPVDICRSQASPDLAEKFNNPNLRTLKTLFF